MNIKNFKKFAKKPCNFHVLLQKIKSIDFEETLLYNNFVCF